MDKKIRIVKVVTRSFVLDFLSNIQNILGKNLIPYEKMVNKGMNQIDEELNKNNIVLKWYRYEITQLTNGALVILLYGDKK